MGALQSMHLRQPHQKRRGPCLNSGMTGNWLRPSIVIGVFIQFAVSNIHRRLVPWPLEFLSVSQCVVAGHQRFYLFPPLTNCRFENHHCMQAMWEKSSTAQARTHKPKQEGCRMDISSTFKLRHHEINLQHRFKTSWLLPSLARVGSSHSRVG
jgi:hypothetical protein